MPGSRALAGLDASILILNQARRDYPTKARPGESWDAFIRRSLPPRLYTLLVAVDGVMLQKEKVRRGGWTTGPPASDRLDDPDVPNVPDKFLDDRPKRAKRAKCAGDLTRANAVRLKEAQARRAALRVTIVTRYGGRGLTPAEVARRLNRDGVTAPRGGTWKALQVKRVLGDLAALVAPTPAPDREPHYRRDPRQIDWVDERSRRRVK